MTVSLWSLTIFLVASLAVLFALTYSAKSRSRAVARLSQSVGLAVPDEHRDALAARAARRSRASVLGAFFGMALVVLGFLSGVIPSSEANGDPVDIWVLLGGYFVGLAVGAMINALTFHNPVPHGSRIARSGAVDLRDYLAPVDLVGARVSVAIGVIVLGVAVALFAMGAVPLNPLLSVSALVIGAVIMSIIFVLDYINSLAGLIHLRVDIAKIQGSIDEIRRGIDGKVDSLATQRKRVRATVYRWYRHNVRQTVKAFPSIRTYPKRTSRSPKSR